MTNNFPTETCLTENDLQGKYGQSVPMWIGDFWNDVPKPDQIAIIDKMIEKTIEICSREEIPIERIEFAQLNKPDCFGSTGCVCIKKKMENKSEKRLSRCYHFDAHKDGNVVEISGYVSRW